jgi:CheY-like chemotaxis protein
MKYIICNTEQRTFFDKVLAQLGELRNDSVFICGDNQLKSTFSNPKSQNDYIIIEASLNWDNTLLQKFYGFDVAALLRRDYLIKAPIIFFSAFEKSYFEKLRLSSSKFNLLNANGSSFLSFPFLKRTLEKTVLEVKPLSDSLLNEVVINYCGLQEKWGKIAHDFRYAILKYNTDYEKARILFNEWSALIERFLPTQKEYLNTLRQLLQTSPSEVDTDELINAYKKLKIVLEFSPQTDSEKINYKLDFDEIEKTPPKFYSTVLVANDEPNLPLPDFLKTNYGYKVLKQATNQTEAKRIFLSEQPEVVIADYYFKTPEEGTEFIEFVADKKHKWQPLVLVNSFRDLSQMNFPDGVINCSGEEAHNPKFIHAQIWKAVRQDAENPERENRADLQEGISHVEDGCRRNLAESTIPGLQFGITRWRKFTVDAVTYSLDLLRISVSNAPNDNEKFLINRLIEVLEPFEFDKDFSYIAIKNLVGMVRSLHKEIDELPISDVSNVLHLIGHTFLSYSLTEIDYSLESLTKLISQLNALPKYQKALHKSKSLLEQTQNEVFYLRDVENLLKSAENIVKLLPELNLEGGESKNKSKKQIRIVVVEDDELYRENFVIPVIEDVKSALRGNGYEIQFEAYENTDEALDSVPILDKTRQINVKENGSSRTLAVVDLYLPKTALDSEETGSNANKRGNLTTPEKQNGLNLIKALRSPNRNIPVIVFSTSGADKDRRDIQRLGVSQKNHINKRGADVRKTLFDALVRNITKSEQYSIESIEEEGRTRFYINDVFIEVDNAETEILKAIMKLCMEKSRFTSSDILNLLNKRITEDSIKKSISSIRKKIQNSLALNGIPIGKDDIIATVPAFEGKKSAYRLAADIKTPEYDEDGNPSLKKSCNVLIVENEPETLSYILSSLKTVKKIKIECATNVEEAVELARSFRSDIISLDLDIPRTREAFAQNPGLGDRNAGLDALDEIRLDFSNVKVILTSTYFNDRILRDRAARLGISNENVVPKFESSGWINLLIQKVKQLRDEVMLGKKADILPDVPEPIIEILDGCDVEAGILKLKINGNLYEPRKSQQAKIIGLLLKNANKILTYEKIRKQLNLTRISGNNRKTWASRIREDIRNLWLQLSESEFPGAEEKILKNLPEKGMTIHAHILNPENLK